MFKHIPFIGLEQLLYILNDIWSSGSIPPFLEEFRVILIIKVGASINSFRPIAISLIICKIVEYILKKRLDYYLESNFFIPNNLYGSRRGISTIDCPPI